VKTRLFLAPAQNDAVVNEARDKGTVPCDSDEGHGRAVTDSAYEIVTALVMLWSMLSLMAAFLLFEAQILHVDQIVRKR